jgi:hypothetical protein
MIDRIQIVDEWGAMFVDSHSEVARRPVVRGRHGWTLGWTL